MFTYLAGSLLSFTVEAVVASSFLVLFASVFPDIDHEGSVIHRRTKAFSVLLASLVPLAVLYPEPVSMFLGAGIMAVFTSLLFRWLKPRHRSITHTFEASVVFSAVAGGLTYIFLDTFLPALFVFVAYLSHVLLDRIF